MLQTLDPIKGQSASSVVELLEKGAEYSLDELRDKAICLVSIHLEEFEMPTIRTILNALLNSEELEGFVSVAAKSFLPGVDGWHHKEIR